MKKKMRAQRQHLKIQQAAIETMERRLMMSVYTVNTTSDAVNVGTGLLTLRQAITDASINSGSNTIQFSPTVFGTGVLHTITLSQGTMIFTGSGSGTITVAGPGYGTLMIDGDGFRVFQVDSTASVVMSGLTVTDGRIESSAGAIATGAGIYNEGTLTLNNAVITGNTVVGGSATYESNGDGGGAEGAAIYSSGPLTLIDSIVSDNTAQAGTAYRNVGGLAAGAGIFATAALSIQNSSIMGNTAYGGGVTADGYANGGASFGGGIYASGSVSISGSSVTNNTANGGNGLDSSGAEDSGAPAEGGGLYLSGATNTISGTTFNANIANGGSSGGGGGNAANASGGAIWASGPLSLTTSTVNGNLTQGGAGAFDDSGPGGNGVGAGIASSASLNISSSSITNNSATGGIGQAEGFELKGSAFGAGVYATGVLAITASTISGNVAAGDPSSATVDTYDGTGGQALGGGLYSNDGGAITSSTISGNRARGGMGDPPYHGGVGAPGGLAEGGGIYGENNLTITNSTVANNSATGGNGGNGGYNGGDGAEGGNALGGGIYAASGNVTANDSTVSGNTIAAGTGGNGDSGYLSGSPGVASGGGLALGSGGYVVLSNSIVDANTSGSMEDDISGSVAGASNHNLIGAGGGQTISNGNNKNIIGNDNPGLSPLGNYGGPTQTMLPLYNSPAVNAGSNASVPAGATTDQRGYSRITGSSVDIGAVELQIGTVSGNVFNDLNGDGTRETGEPGLAGVTVYADLSNVSIYKAGDPTAVTDSNGNYTLAGVPEGAVIIRQAIPSAYRQSYPIGGAGEHVDVTPAGVSGALFAGSTRLYISGTVTFNGIGQNGVLVYADLNNDGQFEPNENNKTTATGGTFSFVSLTPGTYTFRILVPSGEIISGNSAVTVTLGSGGVDQAVNFTLATQTSKPLTGTVIGTTGSYDNQGNTAAKAFDGNLNTYFDAPTASGSWAGLNLGSPQVITQISYAPRSGWASRMVGGMFQGSSSPTFSTDVVTLYTITRTPTTGALTTVTISNSAAYQYVRYIGPANSYCNVAEVHFFGHPVPAATLTANGTLQVTGTSGADNIFISLTPNSDTVTVNSITQTFNPAQVMSVDIITLDGNDTVNITGNDSTGSQELPPVSVQSGNGNDVFSETLNGDGSGNDPGAFITLIAGNGNDSFGIGGSSINASVTAGDGNDTFTTAISGSGNMHATITAGNGNDAMTAGTSGGLGSQEIVFNAGIGVDTIINTDEDDYVSGIIGGQTYSLITMEQELVGNVYLDQNSDGKYETSELLAANSPVTFSNSTDGNFGTSTDSTGHYLLNVYYNENVVPVVTHGWTNPITLSSANGQGELISGVDFALPKPVTGTSIGTSGSFENDGNTIANVFDGNLSTYFDAPTATGNWVGQDLGTPQILTQVEYAPRSGWASRMLGGEIQASNSANFSSGVVTLYTVTSTPAVGVLTTATFSNSTAYRYYRYIGPANSYCNIAELIFES